MNAYSKMGLGNLFLILIGILMNLGGNIGAFSRADFYWVMGLTIVCVAIFASCGNKDKGG